MREWENYKQSEEYANSFQWAKHEEHRQGSMWAAFMAGFLAANPDGAKSDSANVKGHAPSPAGASVETGGEG
jgi:hypothetical protein